jgi:hypothetical protein
MVAQEQKVRDIEAMYQQETETAKTEYDDRTSALQAKITEDEAFMLKHADVIKTINRDMIKDEIDQLVYAHQRRIAELNAQMNEARASVKSGGAGIASDWKDIVSDMPSFVTPDFLKGFDDVINKIKDVIKWVQEGADAVGAFFAQFESQESKNLKAKVLQIQSEMKSASLLAGSSDPKSKAVGLRMIEDLKKQSNAKAGGGKNLVGGTTLVGETGPEIVELPRGANVYTSTQTKNMTSNDNRNVSINNTNYIQNADDFNLWNRNLAYQLKGI